MKISRNLKENTNTGVFLNTVKRKTNTVVFLFLDFAGFCRVLWIWLLKLQSQSSTYQLKSQQHVSAPFMWYIGISILVKVLFLHCIVKEYSGLPNISKQIFLRALWISWSKESKYYLSMVYTNLFLFNKETISFSIKQEFFKRSATLFKRGLWHRRFPVNFAKFLKIPFLQNTSGRLLQSKFKPKYLKFLSTSWLVKIFFSIVMTYYSRFPVPLQKKSSAWQ